MGKPRALQHAGKLPNDSEPTTGHGRTALSVVDVAGAKLAGAAADRGQAGTPDQRREFAAEEFITEAKFAKTVEVITEVEAAASALVPEDGNAGLPGERVARVLGGEGVRRDEEVGHRDRLIVLGGGKISRAQQEIIAPLAPVVLYLHKRDANAGGEIKGSDAGAVNVDCKVDERRPVSFLMGHNAQAGHTILDKAFVSEAVELAFARDAIQTDVERCKIDGTVNGFLQAGGQSPPFPPPDSGRPQSIHAPRR